MKTIPLSQLHLFEKLLGMTTSASDAEALTAMRKANKILQDNGLTWAELLRKQVTSDSVSPYTEPTADATAAHVQTCLDTLRGSDSSFISSLDKQWAEKGYLSPEQRRPLFAMYKEHVSKRA